MTTSNRLQKNRSQFIKALKSVHDSHNLLVVVCENDALTDTAEFYQKLVKKMQNKRVIIIRKGGAEMEEKLKFGDEQEMQTSFTRKRNRISGIASICVQFN